MASRDGREGSTTVRSATSAATPSVVTQQDKHPGPSQFAPCSWIGAGHSHMEAFVHASHRFAPCQDTCIAVEQGEQFCRDGGKGSFSLWPVATLQPTMFSEALLIKVPIATVPFSRANWVRYIYKLPLY